jgi:hypothetical protein
MIVELPELVACIFNKLGVAASMKSGLVATTTDIVDL